MTHHTLKIRPVFMKEKNRGAKLFEIRVNDRKFKKGDTVSYTTEDKKSKYTGLYVITFVTQFAQRKGWVVFGERAIHPLRD